MIFGRTGEPEAPLHFAHRSRIYPTSTLQMPNLGKPELGGEKGVPLAIQLNLISSRFSGNN